MKKSLLLTLVLLLGLNARNALASHEQVRDIAYTQITKDSFEVVVTLLIDCGGAGASNADWLLVCEIDPVTGIYYKNFSPKLTRKFQVGEVYKYCPGLNLMGIVVLSLFTHL